MSDDFEARMLGSALEDAVKAAKVLETAKNEVPGFAEYFDRKHRSKNHMGEKFESRIIDIKLYPPANCVFCVLGYSNSMDPEQKLTATVFRQGAEYPSNNNVRGDDLLNGYQGIMLADKHSGDPNNLAELIVKIRGKQIHFDIPLG